MSGTRLLVCPPRFYKVAYEINPWMRIAHPVDPVAAENEWNGFTKILTDLGAELCAIGPQRSVPDMVFTANAGTVSGKKFIPSRFHFPERRPEEPYFLRWFVENGYEIHPLKGDLYFEGEGDLLRTGDAFFAGYHFRSDIRAHEQVSGILNQEVISLELVDRRFYHLDTCFLPLPGGSAAYFPKAFDRYAQKVLKEFLIDPIEVSETEALRFGCNAVVVGRDIVMVGNCPKLRRRLEERGYRTHTAPMGEFIKAGGACKCLVLTLDNISLLSRRLMEGRS